jgi:tetratricopeptide (TPR) repeat protein
LNLGKILYVRGELKESASHFQKALEIDPGNAEAQVYLKRMVE